MDITLTDYTSAAQASLNNAAHEAATLHAVQLEPEHVLLGLLSPDSGTVWNWFVAMMRDPAVLRSVIAAALAGAPQADLAAEASPSYRTRRVLSEAADEAHGLNSPHIDTPHLLLGLLNEGGAAAQILRQRGLDTRTLRYWLKNNPATGATIAPPQTATPIVERPAPRPEVQDDVPLRRALPRLISWRAVVVLLTIVVGGGYMTTRADLQDVGVYVFIIGGWIASVSAHEFGHALAADLGGDHSVRANGYLSFNPLKYTHVMLSIVMPVIFLLMGGIGLPGGAIYINRAALRGPKWQSVVSAAGPLASLLVSTLLAIPFIFKLITPAAFQSAMVFWAALAGLIMVNIAGVLLNLLPVPPLDGFGIIAPWLTPGLRQSLYRFASVGILLVFILLFWFEPANQALWATVDNIVAAYRISPDFARMGLSLLTLGADRMSPLRLITLNLLNDRSRWMQRRQLIVDQLAALQPDVIALQEVTPAPDNNARWLADQLGGYSVHYSPFSGRKRDKEGVAILSRYKILRAEWLELSTQSRVASLIEINHPTRQVMVATTHLHWWPGEAPERDHQAQQLIDWLTPFMADRAVIVCGDFNGVPESRAIRLMRDHFSSAFALVHGHEPEYTCPTPLPLTNTIKTVRDVWRALRRKLIGLITNPGNKPWRGTLDYIFVDQHVRVRDCQVVLNQPASDDARLYPSDHFGLMAELEIVGQ